MVTMQDRLPHGERQKVTLAIKKVELLTSGEIVVIAARQSDDYIHVPIHIAAGAALAVPFLLPLANRFFTWSVVPLYWVFLIQLITFIVVALVLSLNPLRYWVTPKSLMRKYAHRNAAAQFLAVNAHGTGGRTGVLIFVSLLERYCEIIGDTAIAKKVDHKTWVSIIDEMRPDLRSGNLTDALVHAVERCGHELAKHFPPGAENPNELPDHFIVLN
jgi:putative membrane protein